MKTVLYCLVLLIAGCATTSTPTPPSAAGVFEPKLDKFTAPVPRGGWPGSYVGQVDFYDSSGESWHKDTPISLIIQPDAPGTLRLLGHVSLTAGRRSFFIGGIAEPLGGSIAGEYTDGSILTTTKYIYSLTLNGSFITGTIKAQNRSGSNGTFETTDIWRFSAERLTDFQLY